MHSTYDGCVTHCYTTPTVQCLHVCTTMQVVQPGNMDMTEPVTKSYLVELSVVAPHGQDQIQDDMRGFAEHLKPYPSRSIHLGALVKVY